MILNEKNVSKQFRPIRFSVKFSFEDRENIDYLLSSTYPYLFIPLMKSVTCKIVE